MNNKTPAIAMILKVIAHVRYVILLTLDSSFSPINYGYKKLGELIKATELFDIKILGENKTVMLIRDNRN